MNCLIKIGVTLLLMQISHALLMVIGRSEGTVCLVAAWAQSLFFNVEHVSVFWNMLSVFEGRGAFQIVMVLREHCACGTSPSVLCRGYSVQGWALPSAVIGAQSFSWVLVSWQLFPGSSPLCTILSARDFVYVESQVPCFAGTWTIFLRMSPYFLLKLIVH